MDSCCQNHFQKSATFVRCPVCHQKGKSVQIITIKALLHPQALETIDPESNYAFCSNSFCEVVYFNGVQFYGKDSLKVLVYQKDDALDVPVCYCFGWTRKRLIQAIRSSQNPVEFIREHVLANRCGCEVNNPQGSCCLGNVTKFIQSIDKGSSG
ncbi:(2Fe-2S)-binding protein [Aneurinibacillus thermoaerophilus]|uniref:putative iron-sulfur cluster-binding metallochaperone n=1 Tax=Aneurinibacillus thermoaerophilus TaxID=143495 RepID=UPI002E24C8BA|nr:(2Fe-2S)-binding protein [Aneurinibacillus thermoaerophilus]MED0763822.1 (2Fe-2S)-binding protein [Aneurinibacillus thermoaerophilus]